MGVIKNFSKFNKDFLSKKEERDDYKRRISSINKYLNEEYKETMIDSISSILNSFSNQQGFSNLKNFLTSGANGLFNTRKIIYELFYDADVVSNDGFYGEITDFYGVEKEMSDEKVWKLDVYYGSGNHETHYLKDLNIDSLYNLLTVLMKHLSPVVNRDVLKKLNDQDD